MKVIICVALFAFAFSSFAGVSARRFTKCEVAQIMYTTGDYTMESLPDWMCLVNSESSFNSSAIGGPNSNGSSDWGLFQVNDNFWCTLEGVGNDCNVNCWGEIEENEDLLCSSRNLFILSRSCWRLFGRWLGLYLSYLRSPRIRCLAWLDCQVRRFVGVASGRVLLIF